MTKKFYKSKTMIVNLIALIAFVIQSQYGFVIDAEGQLALLGTANIFLRAITGESLEN